MQDALLYLSLWLNHPKALTGWRSYLVLLRGRYCVWLLCTENAQAITLTATAFKRALTTQRPIMLFPARTRARIVMAAKQNSDAPKGAVKFALARLRIHARKSPTFDPAP